LKLTCKKRVEFINRVRIIYNGMMMESYPAQISPYEVQVIN